MNGSIVSNVMTSSIVMQRVKELAPYNHGFRQMDDIDSGRLFAQIFGDILRYNATAKTWYYFDGKVWKPDVENMTADNLAKRLSRALYTYSAEIDSTDYHRYVVALGDRKKRDIMVKDARDFRCFQQTDLDARPELLNLQNCCLNLKTREVLSHSPELMCSKIANVSYQPDQKYGFFEKFMSEIMEGDEDKIRYLQTILGYGLTGSAELDQMYFCFGRTTRNGKSSLLDTICFLMGDYAANVMPETLAIADRKGSAASPDLARLDGIRFLQMSEPPRRMRLDVALIKQMTGGGTILARYLQQNSFEYTPVFKIFTNCNSLPVVSDTSLFSSGRVKVIEFNHHFTEAEQDKGLKERLRSPEALSGILNWLLEGLSRYHADGRIEEPEAIKKATEEYTFRSDKLRAFFDDCVIEEPFANIPAKDLYEAFTRWCEECGYHPDSKGGFFEDLRAKHLLEDHATVNGKTVRNVVCGYTLADSVQMCK